MKKAIKRAILLSLFLVTVARATPVTIDEFLAQDPQPTGTVTITVVDDCCEEDKAGFPWWPILFAGAVPLAFIDRDDGPPLILPPTVMPTPEQPQPVPEPSALALGLLGVVGFVLCTRRRRFKLLSVTIILLLAVTSAQAKKKTGKVTVEANTPVTIRITDVGLAPVYSSKELLRALTYELAPGVYFVSFTLPDGTVQDRLITIRPDCSVAIKLTYVPPQCPQCAQCPQCPQCPECTRAPEYEFKPEPVTTTFDTCCDCKRDDLKARLDLFAIELHRNPTVRGKVVAKSTEAVDYLVSNRGVDRARLDYVRSTSGCVELLITPR